MRARVFVFACISLSSILITGLSQAWAGPTNVLFIGNSFTHGHRPLTRTYNASLITDLNHTGYGGVPAIFKQFTQQTGLDYNVTIEAVSGQTLSFHVRKKAALIDRAGWDVVILQGYSTEPLSTEHGGNVDGYCAGGAALRDIISRKNPSAKYYVYETWSSPAALKLQNFPVDESGLRAMQQQLQDAAYRLFYEQRFDGVVRVGDAMMAALDRGIAMHIPLTTGPKSTTKPNDSRMDLWDPKDARHASKFGFYLSAAMMYAKITACDPRKLSAGPGTAAETLGISESQAASLHELAYDINALPDPVAGLINIATTQPTRKSE